MSASSSPSTPSTRTGGGDGGGDGGGNSRGPETRSQANRPPRLVGDWEDDRTPDDEPFYPPKQGLANPRNQRRGGLQIERRSSLPPLTYGNRREQCQAWIVDKTGTQNFHSFTLNRP